MENRRRVKDDFCPVFGYLFLVWDSMPSVRVSAEPLYLQWNVTFEYVARLSSEKLRELREQDTDPTSADAWNRALYKHVALLKYLRIFVSHDVLLR